ncbi:amino acid ABC transporter permease, partial [Psychromonas sp. PRT-SC03]
YYDVFIVGLLNTLLVSVIGVICASVIGLFIGIGRLSSNFLISKLSMIYIETFRNIPILLQILFWYNIVLAALPSTRNSLNYFDAIFLNNRGLLLPKPLFEDGSGFILSAFILNTITLPLTKIEVK